MRLDDRALARLTAALAEVKRSEGRKVPRDALAKLGDALPPGVGMTIDFSAAETLGHPIVVLRPVSAGTDPGLAEVTARDREVAGFLATGLRNKDIALALGISLATVKDHVHRILTKTGVDSRTAIAALWNSSGAPSAKP